MKKIILVAFLGLTAIGSYAQNTKDCPCKKKAVHHKVVSKYPRHEASALPSYITVLEHVPNYNTDPAPAPEPCYSYRQHNIVVQECPATVYGDNGDIQYNKTGAYMGYYPGTEAKDENANPEIAPQHTVISNYRGLAPADGNACNDCSPQ